MTDSDMYSNPQKLLDEDVGTLRRDAGHWLKQLRESRGLSQRDLAEKVGVEYYTFISQVESGRGRIPPDRYRVWADALGVPARDFVRKLMRYYDPVTFRILFDKGA
jgi:transcriptional regulator with XRE-family HTH domain